MALSGGRSSFRIIPAASFIFVVSWSVWVLFFLGGTTGKCWGDLRLLDSGDEEMLDSELFDAVRSFFWVLIDRDWDFCFVEIWLFFRVAGLGDFGRAL